LRIVIGLAIAVCVLAFIGGVWYAVFPTMTRQLAERGEKEEGDSDTPSTDGDSEAAAPSEPTSDPFVSEVGSTSSTSAETTYQSQAVADDNPFESTSYESVPDGSTAEMNAGAYATANETGSSSSQSGSGASGVVVPGVVASSQGKTLDLVGSLHAWHDQPNHDLKAIRRIGGDNLAVYAHYSWMTELLPHLGHQSTYDKFDFSKSWLDDVNLQLSGELIPQFQNPNDQRARWKGYPFENMALTHFVGMAGVEDRRNVVAAKLPRSDPRAGIFGYDEVAKRNEIADGESNTIMLIGSGKLASPWVAGGGATVRGAREPYFDELTGFGSQGSSRTGAISVMADGSVRFISSDIDSAAFRAMSTIHGGESDDVSRWLSDAQLTR